MSSQYFPILHTDLRTMTVKAVHLFHQYEVREAEHRVATLSANHAVFESELPGWIIKVTGRGKENEDPDDLPHLISLV